jgi:type II secretory pathway component PulF
MILTPFHLARRAQFYQQLGQMTEAGLSLEQALRTVRTHAGSASVRKGLDGVLDGIQSGQTLGTALFRSARWLPPFDIALLGAGERSGRLPACFLKLAAYYDERARLLRRLIWALAYPVFLIHLAVCIFPIDALKNLVLQGQVVPFLVQKLTFLAPLYLAIFVAAYFAQGTRGEVVRAILDRLFSMVPVVGGARRSMALSRLCLALEALINAGTGIIEAWELAGAACGSTIVQGAVRGFPAEINAGRTPAELISENRVFPSEFAQQYYSAEISGKLDETLVRMHRQYEEKANNLTRLAVVMIGGLVFACVIISIAYQIISFYLGYFGQIDQIIGS